MKLVLISSLFLVLPMSLHAAECELNPRHLGAHYQIVETTDAGDKMAYEMTLWRDNGRVAHQYQDTQITNLWEQVSNGDVRLVRFFDAHQRAIEYQPGEVAYADASTHWQRMNQLVTEQMLQNMVRLSASGEGCELREQLKTETNGVQVELEWMPALNLLVSLKETTAQGTRHWQMTELLSDNHQLEQAFALRDQYQTTDYADIGDNESDPFLLKMINLGHISHGASGFYDEHGHQMQSQNPHQH